MSPEMMSVMRLPENLRQAAAKLAIEQEKKELRACLRMISSAARKGITPENLAEDAKLALKKTLALCDEKERACAVLAERSPLDKTVADFIRSATAQIRAALLPYVGGSK